jgi:pimeloyl-ACP methyl ester carboxylesterase
MTISYFRQEPHNGAAEAGGPRNSRVTGQPAQALPILLVHGIGDNALSWSIVMRLLARDHRVYAIDLPGYGLSGAPAGRRHATLGEMRDVLASFTREVIGQPALVVGNSMGGWLAVKLAWAAPELTRAIVLIDAGGAPLEGRASWEPFGDLIAVRDLKTSRMIFRQMFGAGPLLYLGQRGLQELFQRQVVREFVAGMVAATAVEDELLRPDDLRRLPAPAALIWGLADTFLPRGSLEFFRENLPGAPTLLLRRCGHLPQVERPRAVARFVRAYAAQIETERRARPQALIVPSD